MVSTAVVARGLTTSYPQCLIAMELASQLEKKGIHLDLEWSPREFNEEADALSNMNTAGFSPELRVLENLKEVRWLVLGEALRLGSRYYQDMATRKRSREKFPGEGGGRFAVRRRRTTLKEREPW